MFCLWSSALWQWLFIRLEFHLVSGEKMSCPDFRQHYSVTGQLPSLFARVCVFTSTFPFVMYTFGGDFNDRKSRYPKQPEVRKLTGWQLFLEWWASERITFENISQNECSRKVQFDWLIDWLAGWPTNCMNAWLIAFQTLLFNFIMIFVNNNCSAYRINCTWSYDQEQKWLPQSRTFHGTRELTYFHGNAEFINFKPLY